MTKKLSIFAIFLLAAFAVSCTNTNETTNANANAAEAATTKPGPDDSEITTSVDANGVRTETRTFHNNPRVAKVVVTTSNGTRTVKVYSPSGEERELNKDQSDNVLEKTGGAIADGAGFVAGKTKDAAVAVKDAGVTAGEKTADAAKTVGSKTAEGARTVGSATADAAKTVGSKTAEGAKVVGEKTAEGAKKTGKALKKIIP